MSYYVKRSSRQNPAGIAFIGPIRNLDQACREQEAWAAAGETAEVLQGTPELHKTVKRWEKVTHADDAREVVTFQGQQMTFARYRLEHEAA